MRAPTNIRDRTDTLILSPLIYRHHLLSSPMSVCFAMLQS